MGVPGSHQIGILAHEGTVDHLDLFRQVCERPGMYLSNPSYESVSAFILGFDLASEGGVLHGFREWLVVRNDGGNSLAWHDLVLYAAFPQDPAPRERASASSDAAKHAIRTLLELVREFSADRSKPEGLRRVFLEYESWLRAQDWYTPDSPSWIEVDGLG